MLKKQWNTSKHKRPAKGERLKAKGKTQKTAEDESSLTFRPLPLALCLLVFALCLLLFVSCAPKIAEKPSREGISLADILEKMNTVQSIEAVLVIDYEKNDATMSGDAHLDLSPSAMDLRIYYFGFLYGEVTEDNGVIHSKPKFDKNESTVLVDGLKNSFLWWTIKDYTVQEEKDIYILRTFNRKLIIGKKDLLPLEQTLQLDNGEELRISYDTPVRSEYGTEKSAGDPEMSWYQSRLSILYKNHQVKVKVKSYMASTQRKSA